MKRLLPLLLLPVALVGIAATTYTITQLTLNSSPSDATLIEVYDPSASPKSGKYMLSMIAKTSDLTWTNAASATDSEGGTVYGFYSLGAISNQSVFVAQNYLTNLWSKSSTLATIGTGIPSVVDLGKSNVEIYGIGDHVFNDITETNWSNAYDVFALGHYVLEDSVLDASGEVFGIGDYVLRGVTMTDSYSVYAFGDLAFADGVTIDNSGDIFGIGDQVFQGATISNANDIYAFGAGTFSGATLSGFDIYAIGASAGAEISGTFQHIFMIGSGAKATNNNDFVFGDSAYNYKFPGASASFAGSIVVPRTITAGGTTGNQTINKMSGSVNFAAAAQTITVTDSLVTTSSVIMATVATDDTTAKSCIATPGSGSFVLKLNAAATAETRVQFLIVN